MATPEGYGKKNVDNFALSTDEVLALPERKISKLSTLL